MANGFTHESIPGNFDGVTFVNRDVAALDDNSLQILDGRIPTHPWFTLNVAIWPSANDALNNRPHLRFNNDSGARYEASFRAFVNTSDSPPATEAPSINHVKDQTEMPLLPVDAAFNLSSTDMVYTARIDVMRMDAIEEYRVFCHWSRGRSSASIHPRHGFMVGNWIGIGTKGISGIDVYLGTSGKMAAGAYLEGYGMQSSVLGGGYVYKSGELPTGKIWVDGRPMYRDVFTSLTLPSPGNSTNFTLPTTAFDMPTSRLTEFWVYKTSPSNESHRPTDLQLKFTTTQLVITSPSGGTNWSSYTGVGVWEYAKQI